MRTSFMESSPQIPIESESVARDSGICGELFIKDARIFFKGEKEGMATGRGNFSDGIRSRPMLTTILTKNKIKQGQKTYKPFILISKIC